ncbi:hypothetical protein PIB30_060731 [Stylosanthes scabra]|uniref:Uncharacterized protein n=1 Tax=Stylosanthes scabra TaxID=79078 RepID=A0ABU6QL80_9FABA|nr:hypothetical protein [Stylosanthes scabra]
MDARREGFVFGTGLQIEHLLPEHDAEVPTLTSLCSNENTAPPAKKPLQSQGHELMRRLSSRIRRLLKISARYGYSQANVTASPKQTALLGTFRIPHTDHQE